MVAGQRHRRRLACRSGYALIAAYLVITCLTVWSFTTYQRGVTDLRAATWFTTSTHAFHLAESSVDATIQNLRSGQFGDLPAVAFDNGSYWAEVTPLPNLQFLINGHGQQVGKQSDLDVVVQLAPTSVFQFALFGENQVRVNGTPLVDSYDSRIAPYDSTQPGQDGDVGTNVSTPGGVIIQGSIAINGQIAVGPDAVDPNLVVIQIGGAAIITGDPPVVAQPAPLPMPTLTVPSGLTCDDLSLSGNATVTLTGGTTYCFHDVSLVGNSVLTADGPVKVYITGDFKLGGTGNANSPVVGDAGDSTLMSVFLVSAGGLTPSGTIKGSSQFYGALYAPDSTIDLSGNAEVFGSIIAKQVDASGSVKIHYDLALGALTYPIGFYKAQVISWHQER